MDHVYSIMTLKSATDSTREFEGTATTLSTDLVGDQVVPRGALFKLPLPLLLEHDRSSPIGHVVAATVTDAGISIRAKVAQVKEPGPLRDRLETAWLSIRGGLLRGLSIGFLPLESEAIRSGGRRFKSWRWIELSSCVIPCNEDCSVTSVKAAFSASREVRPGCLYLDGRRAPKQPARKGVVYLEQGARHGL